MGEAIITVDHLWKEYRLGDFSASSLKEEIRNWWSYRNRRNHRLHNQIEGMTNNLTKQSEESVFWALQDINFEAARGEALGIIGKNGAGKSTLLKILSRVTRPTKGRVRGYGRVASMLEVGTGFHPELSGRENIFLNGNILGMSNREIKKKFDSIVDFSGIARFIDTPVKRYSSGMYVRLAFSIAAHLEPDILLLDEVLAVGDTEFQEKSLRRMKEIIANRGSTILFVSHNIPSVIQLCHRAILLKEGKVIAEGKPEKVANTYFEMIGKQQFYRIWDDQDPAPGNDAVRVLKASLNPEFMPGQTAIDVRTPLRIEFQFRNYSPGINLSIGIHLFTFDDECIFDVPSDAQQLPTGDFEATCTIPGNFLNDGEYYISIIFVKDTDQQVFYLQRCLSFDVADYRGDIKWSGKWIGKVRPGFPISIHPKTDESGPNNL